MTSAVLADLVLSHADEVLARRGLDSAVLPATVSVQRPQDPRHGDYATNLALQTASKLGVAPRELAGWLAQELVTSPAVSAAEVAGSGFVNLWLSVAARTAIVRQVLAAGDRFGMPDQPPGAEPSGARWPVGYEVRYAHARLAALARNAADLGITADGADLGLLRHERETGLICALGGFPDVVASAGRRRDRLSRYLEQVAGTHHDFTDTCRMLPIGDEEPGPRHAARLALCQATRQVLANGLRLAGMSAPERM